MIQHFERIVLMNDSMIHLLRHIALLSSLIFLYYLFKHQSHKIITVAILQCK